MTINARIELPEPGSRNDPLCLRIEGWLHAGGRHTELFAVEVYVRELLLGETRVLVPRPDVTENLDLPAHTRTGFALFLGAPELFGPDSVRLEFRARFSDGRSETFAFRDVGLIRHDHRDNDYGILARPDETRLFHRSDIYGSGPSVAVANPECLELIHRYIGSPPLRIIDVGCGLGGYGRALRAAGHEWMGVEVKPGDCAELTRLGLPHRQVDGRSLPFADGAFDAAICIEVLEHVPDPAALLAEMRRVIRGRLIVSVPNLELIPYMHRHMVVPWHMLEGDHNNFFTRASLRHLLKSSFRQVEVLCYARHPLSTPEGLPLYYHLFAVADL